MSSFNKTTTPSDITKALRIGSVARSKTGENTDITVEQTISWGEARALCQNNQMDLGVPSSSDYNAFIVAEMAYYGCTEAWIGIYKNIYNSWIDIKADPKGESQLNYSKWS